MKLAAVLVLAAASTACTAQQSPVGIATAIYKSCIQGYHNAYGWPSTRQDVLDQVAEMDANCLSWTAAWLPPFLHKDRPYLTDAEINRFKTQTDGIIFAYQQELLLSLPKQ